MNLRPVALTAVMIAAWTGHTALAETPAPDAPAPAVEASAAGPAEAVASPHAEAAPAAPAAGKPDAKPASAETVAATDEDPVICRSQVETGTIGRRQKICMTKSQWEAQRSAAKRFKRSIEQTRSAPPAGG